MMALVHLVVRLLYALREDLGAFVGAMVALWRLDERG